MRKFKNGADGSSVFGPTHGDPLTDRAKVISASQLEWSPSQPQVSHSRSDVVPASDLEWQPSRAVITRPKSQMSYERARDALREYNQWKTYDLQNVASPSWGPNFGPGDKKGAFAPSKFRKQLISNMQLRFGAYYAFAIVQNGQLLENLSYAWGLARGDKDAFELTIDQPINMASVAKVITAAALLKAVFENKYASSLSWIYNWFPKSWKSNIDPGFKDINFEHCLRYRLNLDNQNTGGQFTEWWRIREWYQTGWLKFPPLTPKISVINGSNGYCNVCYGWLRYCIFYLTAPSDLLEVADIYDTPATQDALNYFISEYYVSYVRKVLLEPIGIKWADMNPISKHDPRPQKEKERTQTLYFPYPGNIGSKGNPGWDWTPIGAGGGWIMSTRDLARFWAHLRAGTFFNKQVTDLFFNYANLPNRIAVDNWTNNKGAMLSKGGTAGESGGVGYAALVCDLPASGTQLTFMSNCALVSRFVRDNVVVPAYNSSWG